MKGLDSSQPSIIGAVKIADVGNALPIGVRQTEQADSIRSRKSYRFGKSELFNSFQSGPRCPVF